MAGAFRLRIGIGDYRVLFTLFEDSLRIFGVRHRSEAYSLGLSPTELAPQLQVPANRITQILKGDRAITGDTALRLGHYFGMSPQFWLNLQSLYDLRIAEQKVGRAVQSLPTLREQALA